jgi:hypothetical protein
MRGGSGRADANHRNRSNHTNRTNHTNDASRRLRLDRMADDFELTLGLIEQALELEGS